MLVIFNNVAINIDRVHNFWISDEIDGKLTGKFYIKFSDSTGQKILDSEITAVPFEKRDERDKAFQDILFSYAEGKKALGIISKTEEQKP